MCGLGPTFEERSVFAGVHPDICTGDGLSIMESQCGGDQQPVPTPHTCQQMLIFQASNDL